MANKTKTKPTAIDKISDVAMQGGVVLMAAATTLGLVDLPNEPDKRAIVPNQPAFATAPEFGNKPVGSDSFRREREDVHPHYVTYGVQQRTPSRTGKI